MPRSEAAQHELGRCRQTCQLELELRKPTATSFAKFVTWYPASVLSEIPYGLAKTQCIVPRALALTDGSLGRHHRRTNLEDTSGLSNVRTYPSGCHCAGTSQSRSSLGAKLIEHDFAGPRGIEDLKKGGVTARGHRYAGLQGKEGPSGMDSSADCGLPLSRVAGRAGAHS